MRQRLAPPFHLAASQSRPEPARLCKATGRRLPPISSTCCSFVILPSPPRRRSLADRSAELTWSWEMLCPMVTRLRQLRPRTSAMNLFLGTVAEMLSHPHTDACHWPIMQIVEHSLVASLDVLPILVGTSGNVAPRTHIKSHEVRLIRSTFTAAV